ncbi:hypothetical protein CEXT_728061 [Caerostris extrusa]|uniref:Uncharacterized protein n=1 Tax=Caerostris extrusa TaxID=172846 RepID=A0AAV4Q7P9_CAEEX|nr:hypothetical protein CEXT_728061 [Caerostris extrusa]
MNTTNRLNCSKQPFVSHKIVIPADQTPFGQYAVKFNAPTIDEVGVIIFGEKFKLRDIIVPIFFWEVEDGYHIDIKIGNLANGNKQIN